MDNNDFLDAVIALSVAKVRSGEFKFAKGQAATDAEAGMEECRGLTPPRLHAHRLSVLSESLEVTDHRTPAIFWRLQGINRISEVVDVAVINSGHPGFMPSTPCEDAIDMAVQVLGLAPETPAPPA